MHLHRHKPGALDAFVSHLLEEQRAGSAVEDFSRWHERSKLGEDAARRRYRNLIPLSKPGAGEQYAFEVNLDDCSGCKACVTACHALNGLEEGESWRSVGLLVSRSEQNDSARLQHVTTACHHCVEPACMHGCPVLAYEKDPATGIVRHLDDQCIGCTYCVMTCPYEVPRFSSRLGIVRKCDLCHGRLAEGEAPACAQACPNGAIRVTVVSQEALRQRFGTVTIPGADSAFLPSSPAPHLTLPSTTFHTAVPQTVTLVAADESEVVPAPAHFPLVVMLVLTQAAAGLALALPALSEDAQGLASSAVTALAVAGLSASVAHLGQPLRAWRIFLGWRRSWLSREAMLLGAFGQGAVLATALELVPTPFQGLRPTVLALTVLAALPAVWASIKVYAVTGRPEWSLARTLGRFGGTTVLLGAATLLALPLALPVPRSAIAAMATLGLLGVVSAEWLERRSWTARPGKPSAQRRAQLAHGPLQRTWRWRGVAAGFGLAALWAAPAGGTPDSQAFLSLIALGALFASALLERTLFFKGSAPDRMPGGFAA